MKQQACSSLSCSSGCELGTSWNTTHLVIHDTEYAVKMLHWVVVYFWPPVTMFHVHDFKAELFLATFARGWLASGRPWRNYLFSKPYTLQQQEFWENVGDRAQTHQSRNTLHTTNGPFCSAFCYALGTSWNHLTLGTLVGQKVHRMKDFVPVHLLRWSKEPCSKELLSE